MTDRHQHRTERAYEVRATPEEVWAAIATAEGISTWMVPTRLEPEVGGQIVFDFDGHEMAGTVSAYEPGERFAYEESWPLGDSVEAVPAEMMTWIESVGGTPDEVARDLPSLGPIATEFLVESADGSCVVRVVTSSYGSGSDWENEFFAQMVSDTYQLFDRLARLLGGQVQR